MDHSTNHITVAYRFRAVLLPQPLASNQDERHVVALSDYLTARIKDSARIVATFFDVWALCVATQCPSLQQLK
jgi:hypothetical protein